MVASLLGFSMEQLVIDDDIIGAAQRTVRGIDVSEDALSLEAIRETCLGGPNHFLGSQQTLERMQTEYLYPTCRRPQLAQGMGGEGSPALLDRARRKVDDILKPLPHPCPAPHR